MKEARIPVDELWLHRPDVKKILDRAIKWAEMNRPKASDLDQLKKQLERRKSTR